MKIAEVNELTNNEIVEKLDKSYLELVQLRMKLVSRQLEDTSLIKKKRKEIARFLTVQTQRVNKGNESEVKEEVKVKTKVKVKVKTKLEPKASSKEKAETKITKAKKETKKKGSK